MTTTLNFTPASSPALAKRFPKASVVSTVADFDEIGRPNAAFAQAGALHLESIAGVTPAIAAKYPRPFENLLAVEAGFQAIDAGTPGEANFSRAVASAGILNLERVTGVSPEIDAAYPERRAA